MNEVNYFVPSVYSGIASNQNNLFQARGIFPRGFAPRENSLGLKQVVLIWRNTL